MSWEERLTWRWPPSSNSQRNIERNIKWQRIGGLLMEYHSDKAFFYYLFRAAQNAEPSKWRPERVAE